MWLKKPMQLFSLRARVRVAQKRAAVSGGREFARPRARARVACASREGARRALAPWAKVVHLEDAAAEHLAKVSAIRLVHVRLALPADAEAAVLLSLAGQLQGLGWHIGTGLLEGDLRDGVNVDPRVGDAAGIGEHRPHKRHHPQDKERVEHHRVRDTLRMATDLCWRVVRVEAEVLLLEDVQGEDDVAPRDQAHHEEHRQPPAKRPARAHRRNARGSGSGGGLLPGG